LNDKAASIKPGSDGLIFLPYLNGGRSPDNDPYARDLYMGLTLDHNISYIIRSIMEGIVYSLKNSFELLKTITKCEPKAIIASGGGAKGKIFLQMEADVFNKPIYTTKESEQSCLGAAITGAIGVGYFNSFKEACDKLVKFNEVVIEPISENVDVYNEYFNIYKLIYGKNKELFEEYFKISKKLQN